VPVVAAFPWDDRSTNPPGRLQADERFVVLDPDLQSPPGDGVGFLHLRPEKGRNNLARQIRRTEIDPGVFVNLSTEELAAVGPLLPDDLGAIGEALIID